MRWVAAFLGLFPLSLSAATIPPSESNLRAVLNTESFIFFSSSGTITLSAPLEINSNVTIDGAGQKIVIDGANGVILFKVNFGRSLTLKNLALTRGRSEGAIAENGGEAMGGAIQNLGGNVTISDCSISQNSALGGDASNPATGFGGTARGGALYQTGGALQITLTAFVGNVANGGNGKGGAFAKGGAIFASGGEVRLDGCTITDCVVTGGPSRARDFTGGEAWGGAIHAENTQLYIRNSRLARNAACGGGNSSGLGGAISLRGTANGTVSDSIVEENFAKGGNGVEGGMNIGPTSGRPGFGGGLYVDQAASSSVNGSTFSRNHASGGLRDMNRAEAFASDGVGIGGAIYSLGGTGINNSTFYENWSEGTDRSSIPEGGAISVGGGSLTMTHSTVVGNRSGRPVFSNSIGRANMKANLFAANEGGSIQGAIEDIGYNMSSDAPTAFTSATSVSNVDAKLAPYGNYGGATPTIPVLAGSPAINHVTDNLTPEFDQRGRRRPYSGHADVGAYESSAPFFILGHVRGFVPVGMTISHEPGAPEASGRFLLPNLEPGTHAISFTGANALFQPNPATLNVNADMLLQVRGYELHTFAVEPSLAFAGRFNETWDFFVSNDLREWHGAGSHEFATETPFSLDADAFGRPVFFNAVRR